MIRTVVLFASLALCRSHAVVPLGVPAAHGIGGHGLLRGYGTGYGYTGGHGLAGGYGFAGGDGLIGGLSLGGGHLAVGVGIAGGPGLIGGAGLVDGHGLAGGVGLATGHGLTGGALGHHILKRSPHIVNPLTHGAHLGAIAHLAPIAHVAPVAVSHQERLDVHSAPAVVGTSLVAPAIQAVPLLHKPLVAAPLHYGIGHYAHHAPLYPHLGHY